MLSQPLAKGLTGCAFSYVKELHSHLIYLKHPQCWCMHETGVWVMIQRPEQPFYALLYPPLVNKRIYGQGSRVPITPGAAYAPRTNGRIVWASPGPSQRVIGLGLGVGVGPGVRMGSFGLVEAHYTG